MTDVYRCNLHLYNQEISDRYRISAQVERTKNIIFV